MGKKHPHITKSHNFLYQNKTINFVNTDAKMNIQTSRFRNDFEAVRTGGSWVTLRGLKNRNTFS